MKIAVVGSREFKNKEVIESIMGSHDYFNITTDPVFISGGARGVDSIAEGIIDKWNEINKGMSNTPKEIKKIIFLPDWNKYGKSAGFIRNQLIVNEADKVIAFWDGKSKGAKHSIDLAIKAGKPLDIYVR